jgi:predicted unusual protein kinase regulating ubiquinone biosynthesis (AarF/ABC1/UbiB family)
MSDKDKIRSGRVARSLRPLKMGAETAAAKASTALRSIGASDEKREAKRYELHARLAESYAKQLGEMKGAMMKIGQLLSFIDLDMIPERYRELYKRSLGTLQAEAPAMDPALLDEVVEIELGAPTHDVFKTFSSKPIAAASIGQVHHATLNDGTDVAVKVQYPGVAEAIENDLSNGELLATIFRLGQSMMGGIAPKTDPRVIIDEIRDRVSEELDYTIEAENQRYFRRLFTGHPTIRVPAVHNAYSTARVLTTDYVEGMRWADALNAPPEKRLAWGETIYRFSLGSLDRFGAFNADPHPGNYLFHDDGTVTFLDFGCVKVMHDGRHKKLVELIRAAGEGRAYDFREGLVALGFLPADDDLDPKRIVEWFAGAQPHLTQRPYEFTHADVSNFIRNTYDPLGEHKDIVKRFTMPKDNVILSRIDMGLWSILASLGGSLDWRGIGEEFWETGPPVTELGRAEAAWLRQMGMRDDWPPPLPRSGVDASLMREDPIRST